MTIDIPSPRPARSPLADLMRGCRRAVVGELSDDRGDVPGWVLITLMTAGLPVGTKVG